MGADAGYFLPDFRTPLCVLRDKTKRPAGRFFIEVHTSRLLCEPRRGLKKLLQLLKFNS